MTPALQITGLSKSFGGLPAIDDVTLAVAPGERRLIIGPNGAGKTTLFNLITGDLARDAGTVSLFGTDVTRLAPHRRAHRGLARTYQIITLFAHDTLEHNVLLSLLGLSRLRWKTLAALARHAELYDEARRVLALVGLAAPRASGRSARSPTARNAASRSRWRSPRNRASCCSTSRSPGSRARSARR